MKQSSTKAKEKCSEVEAKAKKLYRIIICGISK
jgi:hypothetical protein